MEELHVTSGVDVNLGLNSRQIEERTKNKQFNTTYTKTTKTYGQIFVKNIFTWVNILCFLIAGALIAVGSFKNLFFIVIFMANLIISLVQEIRAKKMVDKINVIYSTKTKVIREGKEVMVDLNKVLQDDVVVLQSGDQVPADCVLLSGEVEANESLLTGESKPIKKTLNSTLLGGSFLVSGACTAMAVKVGLNTYSSTLIKKAREVKDKQSDILRTLNFIIKTIGIILFPLGILTFIKLYASSNWGPLDAEIVSRVSGAITGMMPVGMFLLTSVSLVVGVINLAKHKTLVQDEYSIEMLARTNVLCLDKTGTLTDGTMSVKSVIPLQNNSIQEITSIMKSYVSSIKSENLTQTALISFFGKENVNKEAKTLEFSSSRKFSAVQFKEISYMLGAPEFVTENLNEDLKNHIKELTSAGFRLLLLCKSNDKIDENMSKDNTPLALITIEDNIRDDAKSTIEWFNNNDVEVVIISGDNVDTVSFIAGKVGVKNYDKAVSLYGKTDEEVMECATKYTVFGRVTPEQKCLLVKALKKSGKKVAMTGDGVNDILALKESDCSIAMSSGSEATRASSNLIMLDNNFSAMPKVVAEGRRVINNISKSSALFLTKSFFVMFLVIFSLIAMDGYPLEPYHLIAWETLFIGIPAFFLALQKNNEKIEGTVIASLTSKSIPGAIVLFLVAIASYVYCVCTHQMELLQSLMSYAITFGSFFILLNLSLPLDKYRGILVFSMLTICLLGFFVVSRFTNLYLPIKLYELIFLGISTLLTYILYSLLRRLFEMFFKRKNKKKAA